MAVAHQIGQIFLAGLPVNHIDDDCPHDRTPLLTGVSDTRFWFQDAFAIPKKWLRRLTKIVSSGQPATTSATATAGGS
jgi:hypothetical protein